jgi:hypothetical protein
MGTITPRATPAYPFWIPGDDGFSGFNSDPATASGGGTLIAGTAYLSRLPIRQPQQVNNLWFCVSTTGATTSSGSFIWIVSGSTGAVLAQSADLVTQFTSTGWVSAAMTVPAIVGGFPLPYAVVVSNMNTTQPTLLRQLNTVNNSPQTPTNVASLRWSAKAAFGSAVGPVTLSGVSTTGFSFIIGWN